MRSTLTHSLLFKIWVLIFAAVYFFVITLLFADISLVLLVDVLKIQKAIVGLLDLIDLSSLNLSLNWLLLHILMILRNVNSLTSFISSVLIWGLEAGLIDIHFLLIFSNAYTQSELMIAWIHVLVEDLAGTNLVKQEVEVEQGVVSVKFVVQGWPIAVSHLKSLGIHILLLLLT